MIRIGSLFSGIGGLELGLERAGFGPVEWQCDSDPFARRILARHWPDATRVSDVRNVVPGLVAPVDLICGGFPCQDLSVAGKGAGLDGNRSGLWFEFARVVDAFQPAIVVAENVAHGRSRWLPRVLGDLRGLGYVPVTVAISAGSVGAPHVRDRAFVVADPDGQFLRFLKQREPARSSRRVRNERQGESHDASEGWQSALASHWHAPPRMDRMGNGLSGGLDGDPYAADRLRVLGNAVVPQVAEALGRLMIAAMQAGA